MDKREKKSKGWYLAGLFLAIVLLLISVSVFVLGICAFDTAEYPAFGTTALYPAENEEILPRGAAAVVKTDLAPERGVPAAYFDAETERIEIKYYYGEEDGTVILTDANSDAVTKADPAALRGSVVSYIPFLGYLLSGACTLLGVCISLAVSMALLAVVGAIFAALVKILRSHHILKKTEADRIAEAEQSEVPSVELNEEAKSSEEKPEDPLPELLEEETPGYINNSYTVERLETVPQGSAGMIFRGTAEDLLKLAKIIRTVSEKRSIGTITVEEQYDEVCELKVTMREEDLPLMDSIINMLRERK